MTVDYLMVIFFTKLIDTSNRRSFKGETQPRQNFTNKDLTGSAHVPHKSLIPHLPT
jgi:hypothetical protein